MRFVAPKDRLVISMFPNSGAPGLNKIAYGLMGKISGRPFRTWLKAVQSAKRTNRPLKQLAGE